VDECKPLDPGAFDNFSRFSAQFRDRMMTAADYLGKITAMGLGQGLTLVHFSAQPEPFLTQNTP